MEETVSRILVLDKKTDDALNALAEKLDRSRSWIVRNLIAKAVIGTIPLTDEIAPSGAVTMEHDTETIDTYTSKLTGKTMYEYFYHLADGSHFSTTDASLAICRARRDEWLACNGFGQVITDVTADEVAERG